MSIKAFQRSRIGASLRSILRAATGRNPSSDEINGRVAAYLSAPLKRGLGPGDITPSATPLFAAADYAPMQETDPLGGADGRDISRSWAALVEDYDTIDEALTEFERRLSLSQNLLRRHGSSLSSQAESLGLDALAIESQVRTLFFGGSGGAGASGQGRSVWNTQVPDGLQVEQSTAIILSSGLGILPTQGQAIGSKGGGSLSAPTLLSASDPTLISSVSTRSFLEQPLGNGPAWSFVSSKEKPATLTFSFGGSIPVGALEIETSPGVTITGLAQGKSTISFQVLRTAGTIWVIPSVPLPVGTALTMTLGAVPSTFVSDIGIGSVSSIKAHIFSFDSTANFVWGPFDRISGNLFSVTLDDLQSATPIGSSINMQVSTSSADGPWSSLPDVGKPLVLSATGTNEVELLSAKAQPDPLSQGFFRYPFTQANSLVGAQLTAGKDQAKVEAYFFNWSNLGEIAHDVSPSDWTTPQGTPRTVAMGTANTFRGDLALETNNSGNYLASGSCLSHYRDIRGVDATYIALRDGNNNVVLQPGFNYKFSFSLYTVGNSYLSDVPVGIFNPAGLGAGVYGVPMLVQLNDQQVYRTAQTFSDFNELSSAPDDYGTKLSDYVSGTGNRSYQGDGTSWPPHCGRMSLALSPGWNTLSISFYIPLGNKSINDNLGPNAGIVFGPAVFNDGATLYEATGIQQVRGWSQPWTQLSEFDLRTNTPLGFTNVWAWSVNPSTSAIESVLINHNPNFSETGYATLDGKITGQPRTHHLSYLPVPVTASPNAPGVPSSSSVWIRAQLSSSSPETGPFISGFTLSAN